MEFVVRPAEIADAEGLARAHMLAWQAGYAGLMPEEYLQGLSARLEESADRWRGWVSGGTSVTKLIAEDPASKEILGFVMFGRPRAEATQADVGELYAINLAPAAWGRGIGSALFRAAEAELRKEYGRAFLWVLDTNLRARRFYEKHGWSFDGGELDDDSRGFNLHELRYSRDFGLGSPDDAAQ